MKADFDQLLAQRQRGLEAVNCPYEGGELRQIVDQAVDRAKVAEARSFRRQVLLRYSVAACVAAILVKGVALLPPSPSRMMACNMDVSYYEIDLAVRGMLSSINV